VATGGAACAIPALAKAATNGSKLVSRRRPARRLDATDPSTKAPEPPPP
jgi:hypothetical protein